MNISPRMRADRAGARGPARGWGERALTDEAVPRERSGGESWMGQGAIFYSPPVPREHRRSSAEEGVRVNPDAGGGKTAFCGPGPAR